MFVKQHFFVIIVHLVYLVQKNLIDKYLMQSNNIYYYANAVDVQLDLDPTITTRNRIVYQRTVKIYKGVDNTLQFNFKNSDQKSVNITGWDVSFNVISDVDGVVILSKLATGIDLVKGIVTVVLNELDLIGLDREYYNYTLSVTDPLTGSTKPVYVDDNYDVRGELSVLSGRYPTFLPSIQVGFPTDSNVTVTTSAIHSESPSRQLSTSHTAQFYFDNFTGNIAVQATLDSLPPNGATSANVTLSWATISTLPYVNQTTPDYYNFDGVFTAVRFNIAKDSGTVTSALYRP
jgi:hypothetical protein